MTRIEEFQKKWLKDPAYRKALRALEGEYVRFAEALCQRVETRLYRNQAQSRSGKGRYSRS